MKWDPESKSYQNVIAPSESLSSVKFVFTAKFTNKCRKVSNEFKKYLPESEEPVGVGFRIPKVGVISEDQLQAMEAYHNTMSSLEEVSDATEWMAATSLNRLQIPEGLDEYAKLVKEEASVAMQKGILSMSRDSPFGRISNKAVFLLREDLWLNDDCMMHAMTTLQEENSSIGVISPNFNGSEITETQYKVIAGTHPFRDSNTNVLLLIHVNQNNWCGAVFDFKSTPQTITFFDPQQKPKQLEACEKFVKSLFPEKTASMELKREVRLKQKNGHSCGPLVLLFFECSVRDIAMPKEPSNALMRYPRLRYLLKSLHF